MQCGIMNSMRLLTRYRAQRSGPRLISSLFDRIPRCALFGRYRAQRSAPRLFSSLFDRNPRCALRCLLPAALVLAALLTSCSSSSSSPDKQAKAAPSIPAHFTASNTANPIAKYIELVGFRVAERSAGHLIVQFGAVNHSQADVGDVKMTVNLGTTAAKPGDPPLITFPAQVSRLGPSELKDVSVEVPTKLRVYELPDWQFLKVDFEITAPKE
jgi:hypothetical protein